MGEGSCVVTAVALVAPVAQVQFLAWKLPHAVGTVNKQTKWLPLDGAVTESYLFIFKFLFINDHTYSIWKFPG